MKTLYIIAICLLSTSCIVNRPLTVQPSENNNTYTIEYLFEHEGCKVYRFLDRGYYVYFTNCNGTVTSVSNDSTHTTITNNIYKTNK
ncbi:MAG: hypothetical protein H6Q18_834 [Bacteroidetes bacterium]|nr:hypothetical protein [Bacteroidota bacterium]